MNWLKQLFYRHKENREFAQLARFQHKLKHFMADCRDFDKSIDKAAGEQEIKCGTFVRDGAIITIHFPGRDPVSMTASEWYYMRYDAKNLKREIETLKSKVKRLKNEVAGTAIPEKALETLHRKLKRRLYEGLEHGTPEHRSWLRSAINACVDDTGYVPAPPEELAVR